jgi:hypothetical protein
VGERAGDLVLAEVLGDELDVGGVRLQPVVVVRRDAEAEDVDLLRLAAKPAVNSSEMNVSGRSAICSAPAIVSWSVIVTKSMPRRVASA